MEDAMAVHVSSHKISYYGKDYMVLFHNDHVMQIFDEERDSKLCRSHKKFKEIGRLAKLGATSHPFDFNLHLNTLVLLDPPDLLAA
jgi:hypothetical protein